ncbi:MAG: hypothetical protein QNJ00_11310 [Woeseiaceae bacterium]|nr:hypothetical protein [Woeseiaceae bacterium]
MIQSKLRAVSLLACIVFIGGCGTPDIRSLDPNTGPERTLVDIEGDSFLSTAYWDAGTASEQPLAGGFLGAYLFTVPTGAALGPHDVQLQRFGRRGNIVPFTVTAALPATAPRLDRVSIVFADFQASTVNTWLYVQGANIDAAAEVLINNSPVPSVAHKGIQNDLLGVNPTDLGFPVYHYLALIAGPGARDVGGTLNVSVRNTDGQVSNVVSYTLPSNAATMDRDGDDLLDDWEINGYDADGDGTVDIDLAALGADPLRPDIFLEVDVMQGLTNNPGNAVWNAFTGAFAAAPIINPAGPNGINLVLDTRGTVPFWQTIDFGGTETATHRRFNTLKTANFDDANRDRIYHYCIWANMRPNGSSGVSDVDWVNGGDDCIVSFDDFSAGFQTAQSMAETIMHEFGHNLNQRHGGATHAQNNPTYSSVMSYNWQLRSGRSNGWRRNNPVYAPFFYQMNAAVETNGAIPTGWAPPTIDFSEGMGRSLVENNLSEPVGLYNANAIDWNMDGDSTDTSASRDLNGDGDTNDTMTDLSNWANLVFSGPRNDGTN